MRFAKKSSALKKEELHQWHSWFALRPVRVSDNRLVWMELVERKGVWCIGTTHPWWNWEYRLTDGPKD